MFLIVLNVVSRLQRQVLNMEIQLMKLNEKNKVLEKKLAEKTNLLESTRKKLTRCEKELAKLKLDNEQFSIVRSELLNVSIILFYLNKT